MQKKRLIIHSNALLQKTIIILSITTLSVVLARWFLPDLIDLIEYQTYYLRYKWAFNNSNISEEEKVAIQKSLNVCIVDIDERSVARDKLGYYGNWRRNIHAELINSLSKHFPAAVLFDICFHEPEDENIKKSTSEIVTRALSSLYAESIPQGISDSIVRSINFDEQFSNSTRKAGNIIHSFSARNKSDYTELEWNSIKNRTTKEWLDSLNGSGYIHLDKTQSKAFNTTNTKPVIDGIFPSLGSAARSIGYINAAPNSDGIIRSIPLLFKYGKHDIATLGLSVVAACRLFGTADSEIIFKPGKYLDIGKPFKIFKLESGNLQPSYPHFTIDELGMLLNQKTEILNLQNGKKIAISAFCKLCHDSASDKSYINMNAGDFSLPTIEAMQSKNIKDYLNQSIGSTLIISDNISVIRDSEKDWLLNCANEAMEYFLQEHELKTLLNINIDKLQNLSKEEHLLFHSLSVWKDHEKLFSSIPVLNGQTLIELLNVSWEKVESMEPGSRMEFGSPTIIPLDKENLHTINYTGPRKTFPYYSYYDILKSRVSADLDGKIFIVGSSLPNLFDIKAAPHDIWFPGVEIHATLLNSFLQNSFVTRPGDYTTFLLPVLFALIGAILFSISSPILGSILFLSTVFVHFIFSMSFFSTLKIWIPVAQPLAASGYSFIFSIAYRFLVEEKNKKYLYATFSSYLSPAVIENMYQQKITPTLGGTESEITAFFTDIQGFSSFSEKLGSPIKLVSLLNEYLSAMTDILLENEGTLDKYEGDAIIAFFGAPTSNPSHPAQACCTAIKMQQKLAELRAKWTQEGDKWPEIVKNMRMRIGINSGLMVTGNMGSNKRMNYTMMGDEVNLAARLESAAKQFGVFTLVGENTYKHVQSQFEFRHIDKIKVVGKDIPVNVYELLSENGELEDTTRQLRELYHSGLEQYQKQNFTEAISFFEKSKLLEPYKEICKITASERMIKISESLLKNPPPYGWDGTNELSSK